MLFRFLNTPYPMLAMLEWLCDQLMEVEITTKLGTGKHERTDSQDRVFGQITGHRIYMG